MKNSLVAWERDKLDLQQQQIFWAYVDYSQQYETQYEGKI